MITIINYGSGNVRAIGNIYDKLNIAYKIVSKVDEVDENVTKIILPGVGAFDETMSMLIDSGFRNLLDELVLEKQLPTLGICVGMQILSNGSEEGKLNGLGWIPGVVRKFDKELLAHKPKLPHLGWNSVKIKRESPILNGVDTEHGFYFIHTYYFETENDENILTTSNYGIEFCSSVVKNNIFGTQFHPEKSHYNGVSLLNNFAKL
tara:strand:- start:12050 stop:12667 length:618 start_codon:yes stop_codon:yes gene_type:complete